MNDILPGDNYARARYSELCAALGGEPASGFHRAVLARLAAWTDQPDIDALAQLIRERVSHRTARCRDLLAEVAHHVQTTGAPARRRTGIRRATHRAGRVDPGSCPRRDAGRVTSPAAGPRHLRCRGPAPLLFYSSPRDRGRILPAGPITRKVRRSTSVPSIFNTKA